jgi:hypothetical protein
MDKYFCLHLNKRFNNKLIDINKPCNNKSYKQVNISSENETYKDDLNDVIIDKHLLIYLP